MKEASIKLNQKNLIFNSKLSEKIEKPNAEFYQEKWTSSLFRCFLMSKNKFLDDKSKFLWVYKSLANRSGSLLNKNKKLIKLLHKIHPRTK